MALATSAETLSSNNPDDWVSIGARMVSGGSEQYSHSTDAYGLYLSPFMHSVELTQLHARGKYYYRAGSLEENYWSTIHDFTMSARPGDSAPLRVSVIGDVGQTQYSNETMTDIARVAMEESPSPSFVMLVGDISYADNYGPRWDSWGRLFEPFLSQLPLVTFPGNHEIEIDNRTQETFLHYRKRFQMPQVRLSLQSTHFYTPVIRPGILQVKPEVTGPGNVLPGSYNFNVAPLTPLSSSPALRLSETSPAPCSFLGPLRVLRSSLLSTVRVTLASIPGPCTSSASTPMPTWTQIQNRSPG